MVSRVLALFLLSISLCRAQSERSLIISTLGRIRGAVTELNGEDTYTGSIVKSSTWLERQAETWTPRKPGEGLPLLASLTRILEVLRTLPATRAARNRLFAAVADDLAIKVEHCRQAGLATPQRVAVVTKKNGLQEIPGLAVLYLEKFFQNDPSAKPLEFRGFSSPAIDDLVPGRYVVWAKEISPRGRTGRRKEVRILAGMPKDPIEVLAP